VTASPGFPPPSGERARSPDRGQKVTIRLPNDRTAWLRPTLERFGELLRLPENWNSYGARPVDVGAVVCALQILGETMQADTPAPSIVPTPRGGVQCEWHIYGIDLEVDVTPGGRVTAAWDDAASGSAWEDELGPSFDRLASALADLTRRG
jgi:hypothetical protein